ncbi:hypothetical protein ACLK1T_09975 [Escherichia coli]
MITFIHRDEVYHENSDLKGIAVKIMRQQPDALIGTVLATFNGQWSRFSTTKLAAYDDE